jgi:exonuclease SbcD
VITLKKASNTELDCAVVCAVPYIRPRDVAQSKAGQAAEQKQQNLQQGITEHYQHLYQQAKTEVEKLQAETSRYIPILMTGHLTTVGVSCSDSVREIYIGTLEAFPANAFPKADYIALGHIHQAQKVAKTNTIRYSGSPIALSFDEAKQQKSVVIVDFDQHGKADISLLPVPVFQPLVMIKSAFAALPEKLKELAQEYQAEQQKVWLDVEIESAQYLSDLQPRVNAMLEGLPFELILLRRSKNARQQLDTQQDKITLDEITLTEVFENKMNQEMAEDEMSAEKKARLLQLFAQVVEEVEQDEQL